MKHQLKHLFAKFDALSMRERIFILVGVAVLIYGAMDRVALGPQLLKKKQAGEEITRLINSNGELEAKIAATPKFVEYDPDELLRERIRVLSKNLAALGQHLQSASGNLIPPGEMAKVLEEFVGKQGDLHLVGLRSLDAEPMAGEDANKEAARLYKHGVAIKVTGSYESIRRYLKTLEASPWRLYWESIEVKAEHYPEIIATIGVYTLSLSNNWLSL